MRKKLLAGLAIGLFIMIGSEIPSGAAIFSISNETTWQSSVGSWSTIDFEGFLEPVTTQYPGVTFSGFNGGSPYTTTTFPYKGQNCMFTVSPSGAGGGGWATEFASSIKGFGFWSYDVQFAGSSISIFNSANTLLGNYDLMGSGSGHGHYAWGFNGFVSDNLDIKRVELSIVGTDAIWFDNFQHTPVPVPATVWLLGTGVAGLAGLKIKRKKK